MSGIDEGTRTLAGEADSTSLASIQNALRQLLCDLEGPQDTLLQLHNKSTRVFFDRSQGQGMLSVPQLAKQTETSPQLLVEEGQSIANNSNHLLADPAAEAFATLPSFIVETDYADITDGAKSPFQKAFNTDLPCFAWMAQHPEQVCALQKVMKSWQSSNWMAEFELFEKEALNADGDSEGVFFVDVGLKGQLVLEDLPEVVQELSEVPGLRVEANNILRKQKVKGAKFYYFHHVLHDFPDAQCGSRIFLDEVAVPEKNVPWQSAMADLSMMVLLGGRERTREQWAMLAQESNLQIADVHEYNEPNGTLSWVIVLGMD
ncbi:hypothetical protein BDW69DRAFT_198648 [Aspergillus filifer]